MIETPHTALSDALRVLAIDDNRDNLTTLKAVLGEALPSCRVVVAETGLQGLALAEAEDPDAVLLDIVMPGMDGFEVCRRLKATEGLRDIPVVFLTALRTDRESRVRALEIGAEGFLSKPLDEAELVAQVRAMAKLKAANRLRRLERDELAALVAQRTRALEEELAQRERLEAQLRVSQKMEAIGRLAGGIAHDFNNLLSVILNFTGFALDALPAGDPVAEDLAEVKAAAERGAALTRQLLTFSRKQVLQPVRLGLDEVVAELAPMLRRTLGEDIDFSLALEAQPGPVRVDRSQVEQVIMNLVLNARDAMPTGGSLRLATALVTGERDEAAYGPRPAPGSYVRLSVSDSGCGMDEATLARVFEPFFTTKGKDQGTGLGLATVYGIVTQSGGDISVQSRTDEGTEFVIHFPLAP